MQLPMAALAGYALFGEAPGVLVFAGTVLILPAVMAIRYEKGKNR